MLFRSITDIFNCKHYVDIYINYNCDDIDKVRKHNLNSETEYKIGVENIIINKKIRDRRRKLVIRDVKSVCITMGGSDPCNYTLQVIKEINNIKYKIDISFINEFIELVNKDECCIHHDMLVKYGIITMNKGLFTFLSVLIIASTQAQNFEDIDW